jgi:hypothetical protein
MKEFKIIVDVITIIVYVGLSIAWKSRSILNLFIKTLLALIAISQIIIMLANYGYIIKQ